MPSGSVPRPHPNRHRAVRATGSPTKFTKIFRGWRVGAGTRLPCSFKLQQSCSTRFLPNVTVPGFSDASDRQVSHGPARQPTHLLPAPGQEAQRPWRWGQGEREERGEKETISLSIQVPAEAWTTAAGGGPWGHRARS